MCGETTRRWRHEQIDVQAACRDRPSETVESKRIGAREDGGEVSKSFAAL